MRYFKLNKEQFNLLDDGVRGVMHNAISPNDSTQVLIQSLEELPTGEELTREEFTQVQKEWNHQLSAIFDDLR